MSQRLALSFALLLTLQLAAGAARAQDPDARAMELYDNGVVLYDGGRYEDAIIAWQEAYRFSERPVLLYNIANAEERLGQYQDALDHLNRYRAYATPDERATLDRRISSLERRLEEKLMVVVPSSAPAPSQLTVPAAAPSQAAALPPPPVRRGVRAAPILLYAVGAVGLGTGGAFGVMAYNARNEARDLCVASGEATWCSTDAQGAIQRDQTWSVIADVGFAVGIGGALGGSIALAIPRTEPTVGLSAHGGREGAALRLGGRF